MIWETKKNSVRGDSCYAWSLFLSFFFLSLFYFFIFFFFFWGGAFYLSFNKSSHGHSLRGIPALLTQLHDFCAVRQFRFCSSVSFEVPKVNIVTYSLLIIHCWFYDAGYDQSYWTCRRKIFKKTQQIRFALPCWWRKVWMLQMANRRLIRAVFSYYQWKEMRTYFLVILILMNQRTVRVGHKAEVYNMLIVARKI